MTLKKYFDLSAMKERKEKSDMTKKYTINKGEEESMRKKRKIKRKGGKKKKRKIRRKRKKVKEDV